MRKPKESSVIPCTCPHECHIHEPIDVVREDDAQAMIDVTPRIEPTQRDDEWILWEWDWAYTTHGDRLHHAREIDLHKDYDETAGNGVTSCGRTLWLAIPGMFSRMGMERCGRCCDALGYPRGVGSPKNDEACRPLVEKRLEALGVR